MSDGKKLVSALLAAGSVETLRLVSDDLFLDDELSLFRYVRTHMRRYSELPRIATIEADLQIRLPRCDEPVAYYLRRVYDRKLHTELREGFNGLRNALQTSDLDAARALVEGMRTSCRVSSPDNDMANLSEASLRVMQMYDEAHLNPGMSGVPTGWPRIDQQTGGYQRGDLVTWVARMGVGKTFLMLKQALHAWENGYSVLIVSMEMTIEQIVRRILGLQAGINPDYIRKGTMCEFSHRRLNRYVESIAQADRLHIFAGSFSKKVGDLDVLINELCPDIVYIDGAYLMHPDTPLRGGSRLDRVPEVYDALKRMTITADRPIVTTTQFSRQAGKRGKDGSLETISFSDAIAMHSSLVFGIKEGVPPFQTTRRVVDVMKGREGESGEFQINYQFTPVDFGELLEDQVAAESVDLDWMTS
jgi:replicative DNA helicase